MDIEEFSKNFDLIVGTMAKRNGGSQRGRSVFIPIEDVECSIIRGATGRQALHAPPTYTAYIRHQAMRRCLTTELPTKPSVDTDDYLGPITSTASFEIRTKPDIEIVDQLHSLADEVENQLAGLPDRFSAQRIIETLSPAVWIHRIWIEDMQGFLGRPSGA